MFRNPFVKKKIVCIGGGNAMPKAVLSGLKNKNVEMSVVSAVLDSGGSSGRLRQDYDIISPGDVRKAFIELCNLSEAQKEILSFRFPSGELAGHSLGNLIFVAMYMRKKGYRTLFETINSMIVGTHRILPSTIHKADLVAILEDGQEIVGEANIDVPKHDPTLKIKKLFLRPRVTACPQTVRRIKQAEMVVIGPGDIYSSLMQVLLVDGTWETIRTSKAKKVYVANLMTKNGESNGFNVENFVCEIENCLKCRLDYVIFNTNIPDAKRVEEYKKAHPELLDVVKCGVVGDKRYIGRDLLPKEGNIAHDPEKLARILLSL